ncbi:stage II sporulation protein D [Aquibacillus salsiterrae]|uniref:Stage II sporulation protein D n=1 Tax=Aquibacillus salsiterrae TaxID=2950439 RepID=A0A9X4AED1_9BACI|nr:stage II sporulation protein D [Aquibacillus salsiterrae]MDC3416722.1 stage II sporulation protein D [Aquibacillus salsiterrae]
MHKRKRKLTTNSWRRPSLILIASLVGVILIIPTVIVVPYIGGADPASSVERAEAEAKTVSLNPDDSVFSVKVFRTETNKVEEVPLEDYVTRVVASEMPADFEIEALKAQALAARTYVVNYLLKQGESTVEGGADVTDTVQHQVYKSEDELKRVWGADYNWKINKIRKAVAATVGEIVTYEQEPITPAFFSTSNGYTEDSEEYWSDELPYLRSVASPWDKDSPKYMDQAIFTIEEVEQKLGVTIADSSPFQISRTKSNRVDSITIGGKEFSGRDVREKLDLKSSDFTVEQKKKHLVFKTKGYGHGVGMSQYGANGMAKEGKSYRDIVTYYYQGVTVQNIEKAVPELQNKQLASKEQ